MEKENDEKPNEGEKPRRSGKPDKMIKGGTDGELRKGSRLGDIESKDQLI